MPSMSGERWSLIQRALDEVLDAPPHDRAAVLDSACAGDPGLRAEVARLVESCEKAEGLLEQPAAEFAGSLIMDSAATAPDTAPSQIGPYRILGEAGQGGMATVHLAERTDDPGRVPVALKVVRPEIGLDHVVRRFVAERRILASMEHPGIARLLDGGVTADGLPYFVMEYVRGIPIDRYCDEQRLGIDERLALFCRVCEAVEYAHRKLVVHRDLKPSNILVTAEGTVKLLDFGIAKLLAPDATTATSLTLSGVHPMTPEYASPEQLRADPVSASSDVYSLGVLLYALLGGMRPYAISGRRLHELEKAILIVLPEPPSVRLAHAAQQDDGGVEKVASIARARSTTVNALLEKLAGDLDAITLRALEKEPARRHASAEELLDAVRRHLEGRPVAVPASAPPPRSFGFFRRRRT